MTEFFLCAAASNLLVSAILASIAYLLQRRFGTHVISNAIWVGVLIKLVTPPLFTIELIQLNNSAAEIASVAKSELKGPLVKSNAPKASLAEGWEKRITEGADVDRLKADRGENSEAGLSQASYFSEETRRGILNVLLMVWGIGSIAIAIYSLMRIVQFHSLLKRFGVTSESDIKLLALRLSQRFRLNTCPEIVVIPSAISPFVWWVGGKPQIVLPKTAVEQLESSELEMVLAHELAHISRKDHWVRWLEWVTLILFWWNPIVWLAKRELRITEELACDDLVVTRMGVSGAAYATSLLNVAELLSTAAIRPPTVASAMTSGGSLEKRLKMIIKTRKPALIGGSRLIVLLLVGAILPLGFVYGQDIEAVKKRLGKSVEAGEISKSEAGFMLDALMLAKKLKGKNRYAEVEVEKKENIERKKAQYNEIVRDLKAAVENGRLKEEQAEREIIELRKRFFDREIEREVREDVYREQKSREMARRDRVAAELAELKEVYNREMQELEMAVRQERLSKRDAELKAQAIKSKLFGDYEEESNERRRNAELRNQKLRAKRFEERKGALEEVRRKLELAVKSGDISELQADEKLAAYERDLAIARETEMQMREKQKRAMEQDRRDAELAERKERFMQVENELREAVERERISERDAKRKLEAIKKEMFGEWDERKRDRDKEVDYSRLQRRREAEARYIEATELQEKMRSELEKREREMVELRKALEIEMKKKQELELKAAQAEKQRIEEEKEKRSKRRQ